MDFWTWPRPDGFHCYVSLSCTVVDYSFYMNLATDNYLVWPLQPDSYAFEGQWIIKPKSGAVITKSCTFSHSSPKTDQILVLFKSNCRNLCCVETNRMKTMICKDFPSFISHVLTKSIVQSQFRNSCCDNFFLMKSLAEQRRPTLTDTILRDSFRICRAPRQSASASMLSMRAFGFAHPV